jgi:predicted Rossmann fold flavoprotein
MTIPEIKKYDIIVIGGGPAGIMAAGTAAEQGKKVLLLEKMHFPGLKLRITGKGRCNITNKCSTAEFIENFYTNSKFLIPSLKSFSIECLIKFMHALGINTIVERGNRVFPENLKAPDIQQALIKWIRKKGVSIITDTRVKYVKLKDENTSCISEKIIGCENKIFKSHILIIASGGASYPRTGSTGDGYAIFKNLGHTIIPVKPGLVPLITNFPIPDYLTGLTLKNSCATLYKNKKKTASKMGEIQFYEKGLTGPVILNISRFIEHMFNESEISTEYTLSIDLKPALDYQKMDMRLQREILELNKKSLNELLKKIMPIQLSQYCCEINKLNPKKKLCEISKKERTCIRNWIKNIQFSIKGTADFNEAIITCGGLNTREFSPATMESKKIKGLFAAGEIFDLQADTGGFNLQAAFSTGYTAGLNAAKICLK